MHKLSPPWEGPFAVSRVLGNDANYITDVRKDDDGNPLTREVERPWNVNLLSPLLHVNHHVTRHEIINKDIVHSI
jgi:hypothetical protein